MDRPPRFLRDFTLSFMPIIGAERRRNGMNRKLDRFDVALLNLLQADNLATAEALAKEVALSPSAIARRVRSLREDGLIEADRAILAPQVTADRLRAIVQVQVHEHGEGKGIADLRRRLVARPEVQLLLNIAGSVDLLLLVVARNMAEFNAFAESHLSSDPAVRRYETSVVKAVVKQSPTVWLDDGDVGR
jgi:Lrp/AsnC family leucine-responsive transcriptional regulator